MFSVSNLTGQPWGTSVFGDTTYSADLSAYRTEIYNTIAIPGDVNFDGIVNSQDLAIVVSEWMQTGTGANDPAGDVNHDGVVNSQDLAIISSEISAATIAGNSLVASVPEPSGYLLAIIASAGLMLWRQRHYPSHQS